MEKYLSHETYTPQSLKRLPHSPGVYIYRDNQSTILYIGKAVDLYKRVHQYFKKGERLPEKTRLLVLQIESIEVIRTLSEFDALLLEANLIYKNQPKYNVLAKDDKSPLYICITFHDELPRITYIRKPNSKPSFDNTHQEDAIFGPFQSAKTARMIMQSIRRIIPYCTQKKRTGVPCFYVELGLCQPCPSYIAGMEESPERRTLVHMYRNNHFRIRDILSGKSTILLAHFEHEMRMHADALDFEHAAADRNKITALQSLLHKHYDPMIYVQADNQIESIAQSELNALQSIVQKIYPQITLTRIECYDISHLGGTDTTGSMVVLTDGIIDTRQYRRFKIRLHKTPDDFASMTEIVSRRLVHKEWPYPDLIIVDGGKGQVSAIRDLLKKKNITIPLIGLAKRYEEIIYASNHEFHTLRIPYMSPALHIMQRIRDEAHRFAITYHRKLRKTI